jgi:uncharacterized membrane protein
MSLAAENYVVQNSIKRLGWTAWSLIALVAFLWTGLIVAAPVLQANDFPGSANFIYAAFSYLCHQIAERSFYLEGHPLAVCSRCFGVYAGLAAGVLMFPVLRSVYSSPPPPRIVLFLAPVPTAIDWALGVFGIWENTHFSRFATAAILGAVCAFFVVPAVVEITRFVFLKNKRKRVIAVPPAAKANAPSDYSRPDLRI